MPMARGYCPADPSTAGPSGWTTFWQSGLNTGNTETHSGPEDFALDGTRGQRVCLYAERLSGTTSTYTLWVSKLLEGPPPPSASRGKISKLACAEQSDSDYDCAVKWTYRDRAYRGHVDVSVNAGGTVSTKLDIRRKRR
jgi:hypothetical protein